ncbi:MAG: hypothetical protein LBU13_03995 [Synergistaceae bacterium]|jgi:hypothetical protein|nr:hypothetical protein [Synergistaceae bacterium]
MAAEKSGHIKNVKNVKMCLKFMIIAAALFLSAMFVPSKCFGLTDFEMASALAKKLGDEFKPESLSVKVLGNRAYAEAGGVFLGGVRVDTLKIEAMLTSSEVPEGNAESLASIISYSWGEVTLLASDVNDYFRKNKSRGFSDLKVEFNSDGFRASGVFTTSLLFTFKIMLSASGKFGLHPDGVYIEDAMVYIRNVRQPGFLVKEMMERANPLIKWSEIPFRIVFRNIAVTEHSATMSGAPRDFNGGSSVVWNPVSKKAEAMR